MAALVRAAGTVAKHAGVPVALIGGLAVTCRISTGTRATDDVDVDVVTDTEADLVGGPSAADNLVAMKLHAIQSRAEERKRASDAWDLARLLDAHNADRAISRALETGPADLDELVAKQLRRAFVDDVTRTRRRLVVYGDPSWSALLSEDRLIALAEELSL